MTPKERAAWCIAQAEEMEKDIEPQEDPHQWTALRPLGTDKCLTAPLTLGDYCPETIK